MKADQQERTTATRQAPAPRTPPLARNKTLTALGAIAAVLVLAVLAASLFSYFGSRTPPHSATPTPFRFQNPTPIPTWQAPPASTVKGTVTEFSVPTAGAKPNYIVAGPDGNLWFSEEHANKIGRSTPQGSMVEFAVPTANAGLTAIAVGRDGNLWFTETATDKIGRITPQGAVTEFAVPTTAAQPGYITAGHDGNVWFTEMAGNKIGKITPQGAIKEFAVPTANALPQGITAGGDGNVWFAEYNPTQIGKVTPQGAIKEFAAQASGPLYGGQDPTFSNWSPDAPVLLAWGVNGELWWEEENFGAGTMTPDGTAGQVPGQAWAIPGLLNGVPSDACFRLTGNYFAAPDGALWFTNGCYLYRQTDTPDQHTPYGKIAFAYFKVAQPLNPSGLIVAPMPDGSVWFVGESTDQIGRLT